MKARYVIALAALVACETDPFQTAKVDFLIEAPLCSMTLPVSLTIDGTQVGSVSTARRPGQGL